MPKTHASDLDERLAHVAEQVQLLLGELVVGLHERAKREREAAASNGTAKAAPSASGGAANAKLTPKEVAARLNVRVGTLANWRHKGIGPPFYRAEGVILYDASDVEAYLAVSKVRTQSTEGRS